MCTFTCHTVICIERYVKPAAGLSVRRQSKNAARRTKESLDDRRTGDVPDERRGPISRRTDVAGRFRFVKR